MQRWINRARGLEAKEAAGPLQKIVIFLKNVGVFTVNFDPEKIEVPEACEQNLKRFVRDKGAA